MSNKYRPDVKAIAEEAEKEFIHESGENDCPRMRKKSKTSLPDNIILSGEPRIVLRRRSSESSFNIGAASVMGLLRWKTRASKTRVSPIMRFRRTAKLAVICFRLCKHSYESVDKAKNEFLSVVQVSKDMEANINKDGLYFDPNDFKANKERRLGLEAKRLLQMKPDIRTEKDIDYLQIALRRIKAFAEYPKRMQRKLVQVGWYEGYEPKRAIVRQGHVPKSFYFIISGTVVVTAYDKNAHASRTLVFLYQGMSFGELAVITRSVRQATVSSNTDTELLCISSQVPRYGDLGKALARVEALNQRVIIGIQFLKHIPISNLLQNSTACLFHYFDRGQVMVRDSNKSDWIYVVKSGSLSVLKKLLEVIPESKQDDTDVDDAINACGLANNPYLDLHAACTLYERYGQNAYYARRRRLRQLREKKESVPSRETTYRTHIDMERRLAKTLPGLFNHSDRLGVIDYDAIIDTHKSRITPRISMETERPLPLDSISPVSDIKSPVRESEKYKPPGLKKTYKGAYLSYGSSTESPRKAVTKKDQQDKDMELLAKRRLAQAREQQQNLAGRKTIAEEFDNKPISDSEPTIADLHPMFILVQILERGQYFGINQMIYTDQPSLSVVSNGAECIMISKKFFTDHSKAYAMHYLRLTECPYPSEENLQGNLQDYVNWEDHRSRIYHRLVDQSREKIIKKKQFLPRIIGQYSHRTGPL